MKPSCVFTPMWRKYSLRSCTTTTRVCLESAVVAHGARTRPRTLPKQDDPIFVSLSVQIDDLCSQIAPSQEQVVEKDSFMTRLQRTVESVVDGAVVSPFGSAVTGFWSPNSDIDVCIQTPGCRTRASQIQALRKIAFSLHTIPTHYIEPRFGARVPIIHWAPRRPGYLACDISINNNLAVINSKLIGAYSSIDPRFGKLGLVIKHWAKARGINDRSRGTVSSFSLVLMLIHFLQRRPRPILPSLQDLALELNEPLVYCQGADVRFATDPAAIKAELDRLSGGQVNDESLGFLLFEFFRYYGFEYKKGIIGVRDLRPFHAGEGGADSPVYLVVDNPFEVGKDVANVSPSQHARIRQELKRAKSLIDDGNEVSLSEICAEPSVPTSSSGKQAHPLDPPMHALGRATQQSTLKYARSR